MPSADPNAPGSSGNAMEQLARRLGAVRELAEQARRDEKTAQEMRRRAEELLNQATPEERQRLEELARQLQGQSSGEPGSTGESEGPIGQGEPGAGPGAERSGVSRGAPTEPKPWAGEETVDARPKVGPEEAGTAPQREAARWSGDAPQAGPESMIRASPGERARQAARGLERAIEQQAVPGPYTDIVRRVQRRYAQRAAAVPATGPSAVTPDAPEAGGRPR